MHLSKRKNQTKRRTQVQRKEAGLQILQKRISLNLKKTQKGRKKHLSLRKEEGLPMLREANHNESHLRRAQTKSNPNPNKKRKQNQVS